MERAALAYDGRKAIRHRAWPLIAHVVVRPADDTVIGPLRGRIPVVLATWPQQKIQPPRVVGRSKSCANRSLLRFGWSGRGKGAKRTCHPPEGRL
jgi:hypothetical protein